MDALFSLSIAINLIGAIQGISLSLMLMLKRAENKLNILIGVLLMVLSIIIGNTLIALMDFDVQFPYYQDFANATCFLIGPLLLLLVKSQKDNPIKKNTLIHLAPFVLFSILCILIASIEDPRTTELLFEIKYYSISIFWHVHLIGYLALCYKISRNEKKYPPKDTLWIKQLIIGFIIVLTLNFLIHLFSQFILEVPSTFRLNITLLLVILVAKVAYKSFSSPVRASQKVVKSQNTVVENEWDIKLKEALVHKKMYKNKSLKLTDLANEVGIKDRQLSTYIKQKFDKNFNEFINYYRLQEVLSLINSGAFENVTIMGMAEEAGFKSNSVFYQVFKANTGMLPKTYIQKRGSLVRNHDS